MAEVYAIAFFIVGAVLGHAMLTVWLAVLMPGLAARAAGRLQRGPLLCWVIGVVACLATVGLMLLDLRFRDKQVQGLSQALDYLRDRIEFPRFYNDAFIVVSDGAYLLAAPVMIAFTVGGASIAKLFADRSQILMRQDRPLLGLAIGALCTSASYFVPMLGWFVFVPLVAPICVGAGLLGLFGRRGSASRTNQALSDSVVEPAPAG